MFKSASSLRNGSSGASKQKSAKKKVQRNPSSVPPPKKKVSKKFLKCALKVRKIVQKKNSNLISPPIFITGPQFRDLWMIKVMGYKKGYTFTIPLALKNILLAQWDFIFFGSFFSIFLWLEPTIFKSHGVGFLIPSTMVS